MSFRGGSISFGYLYSERELRSAGEVSTNDKLAVFHARLDCGPRRYIFPFAVEAKRGATMRQVRNPSIIGASGESTKIAACLLERGGLETAVPREDFPKENTRECWDISGRNRLTSSRE